MSAFRALDDIAPLPIWTGILARVVEGRELTFAVVELDPHASATMHQHTNEQIGLVLRGTMTFTIGGDTRVLKRRRHLRDSRQRPARGHGRGRRRRRHRRVRADPRGLASLHRQGTSTRSLAVASPAGLSGWSIIKICPSQRHELHMRGIDRTAICALALLTGAWIGLGAQQAQQSSPAPQGVAPVPSDKAPGPEFFTGTWGYNADYSLNAATGRPEQNPKAANTRRPAGSTGAGAGGPARRAAADPAAAAPAAGRRDR